MRVITAEPVQIAAVSIADAAAPQAVVDFLKEEPQSGDSTNRFPAA